MLLKHKPDQFIIVQVINVGKDSHQLIPIHNREDRIDF